MLCLTLQWGHFHYVYNKLCTHFDQWTRKTCLGIKHKEKNSRVNGEHDSKAIVLSVVT